jgi:hypothetical protein
MGGDSPSPAPPPAQSYLNLGPVDAARVTTRQSDANTYQSHYP